MAIVGFIFCVIFMLYITAGSLMISANSMGRYTIGGEPNTWLSRLVCLLLIATVLVGWTALFYTAPFTISFKG